MHHVTTYRTQDWPIGPVPPRAAGPSLPRRRRALRTLTRLAARHPGAAQEELP